MHPGEGKKAESPPVENHCTSLKRKKEKVNHLGNWISWLF